MCVLQPSFSTLVERVSNLRTTILQEGAHIPIIDEILKETIQIHRKIEYCEIQLGDRIAAGRL